MFLKNITASSQCTYTEQTHLIRLFKLCSESTKFTTVTQTSLSCIGFFLTHANNVCQSPFILTKITVRLSLIKCSPAKTWHSILSSSNKNVIRAFVVSCGYDQICPALTKGKQSVSLFVLSCGYNTKQNVPSMSYNVKSVQNGA